MRFKKITTLMLAFSMTIGLMAGCGSSTAKTEQGTSENSQVTTSEGTTKVEITFLNSKGEIQESLENLAVAFEEETGIKVEIVSCLTGESPYTKITSAYNSGTAPTMAMLDPTDIVSLAEEYAMDLSEEEWVKECEGSLSRIEGKIYGFPFCVEGRGLIYNKTTIEKVLGKEFDPASINSYDALKGLLESLRAAGMENPVVISKEDWSLGNHQLGFIYDTYDGTTEGSAKLINDIKTGTVKTNEYERYNQFIETFDLLKEYNINKADPLGALYDQDPIFLVDEEAALWANGCWAWPNLVEAGAETTDEYGFLPFVLGNDTNDFANNRIEAAATKFIMIDNVQATEEQKAAAKEFLNWMVYSETGQKMLVEEVAIIPACTNNKNVSLDPLSKDIQTKIQNGQTYSSSFIAPGDHWSVLGASVQKYLAGESSKEELATEVDNYWAERQ